MIGAMIGAAIDAVLDAGLLPLGLALAAAIFIAAVAFDARARSRRFAAELARPPATPPSVYPRINTEACICSGACVPACPEGDVIAMIDGRPRLVRPSACIGHADCLRSCPVQAIELVLGSTDRPVEVPVASGAFETTVPGLYVAGEITGMGLIHNAVAQGRQVAAAALDDATGAAGATGSHAGAHDRDFDFDLIVVGAGPAGLAAALEARRRGARCLVFEKGAFGGAIRSYPRQKVVMTAPLDLPGYGKVKLRRTSKEALLELFEDVVRQTALQIVEHAEVTAIRPTTSSFGGGGLRVETAGRAVTARRVILAIGRRGTPRRLGVPGDDLPHVVYEVLDPSQHAGAQIAIVGGGDSAVELALALAAQPGTRVALVHRGADFGRCKPDNQAALDRARVAGRLAIHLDTTVRAVTRGGLDLATAGRPHAIAASLVVCCLGADLPSRWLRGLGITLRELRGEPLAPSSPGARARARASH